MKRFALREFLFLCAPIALIGAGITAVRLLNPPRDPDAVIALKVALEPRTVAQENSLIHGWKVRALGGPKDDIQLLYTQKLIASGHGRTRVLLQEPGSVASLSGTMNGAGSSSSADRGDAFLEVRRVEMLPYDAFPIWTEHLQWSSDVVALPQDFAQPTPWKVGNSATFPTLARLKGAARVSVTLPVAFDASKVAPFQQLRADVVAPIRDNWNADTSVTTQLRSSPRRVHARLVAFNGTTKRELWSNLQNFDQTYWKMQRTETNGHSERDTQIFRLREVPVKWGEIVYIVDAAFDPAAVNANSSGTPANAAEIARLKRAGWFTFSKRLTLRKMGEQVILPDYSRTPNTQFLGVQTSVGGADWIITVRLKYNGPKLESARQLHLPTSPEFTEANGNYLYLQTSTSEIEPSSKPGEYVATITIPLQSLGQPRPLTMKMEVADAHAAPLHFEAKLMVPEIPAP